MTFEQLLKEYFLVRLLRPDTQSCYCMAVNQFTHWRDVLPTGVIPHMVLEWRHCLLNMCYIKSMSWNHYMHHMRALYNFAVGQGLLGQPISLPQKTSLRESRKKKKTLTREQILASREVLNQFIEWEKMQRGCRLPLYSA